MLFINKIVVLRRGQHTRTPIFVGATLSRPRLFRGADQFAVVAFALC